jgi:putative tryptophan/tyrosine transport system substrate-binding protein
MFVLLWFWHRTGTAEVHTARKITLFFASIRVISNVQMRRPLRKTALGSILIAGAVLALAVMAEAQQPKKVPRVGVLVSSSGDPHTPGPRVDAFRLRLRELGYIEGKNIQVEYRYVQGNLDQVPGLVTELVQLKVDLLVVGTLTGIRAAKQATKAIPIVMVTAVDPVATGLVDSLAHPGANITGVRIVGRELSGKRLELFKEVVPSRAIFRLSSQ